MMRTLICAQKMTDAAYQM